MRSGSKIAFTLVEVLIVVIILAIIATIVLPRFSNASAAARASMLADDLRILRTQIVVFKGQHRDVPPGYPGCDPNAAPTEAAFGQYMTQASNANGDFGEPGSPGFHGPYFREIPLNPVNQKRTIEMVGDGEPFPANADDSHGWIYQPSTLTLKADATGSNEFGKAFIDY
ncbi:MAG: prepilin-type N-terminal cleavage/methylation domain-containing protein [Planctomycetota bacterium]|nr:prepilin-type N-terminal cleavage/methylation domain-containing protein [Planctomycetota bacterium]